MMHHHTKFGWIQFSGSEDPQQRCGMTDGQPDSSIHTLHPLPPSVNLSDSSIHPPPPNFIHGWALFLFLIKLIPTPTPMQSELAKYPNCSGQRWTPTKHSRSSDNQGTPPRIVQADSEPSMIKHPNSSDQQ